MLLVSIVVVCCCGLSRVGLCMSDSVGYLGMYVFGSLIWCLRCVGGVFILVCCVFLFFVYFALVLVRGFLYPRRSIIYCRVPDPLYCGGPIGTLCICL